MIDSPGWIWTAFLQWPVASYGTSETWAIEVVNKTYWTSKVQIGPEMISIEATQAKRDDPENSGWRSQ